MKRPPSLQPADRVVILSPAGRIDGSVVEGAAAVLESWGFRPEVSEHALGEAGRFSGSIAQRLGDLQQAFDDPGVKLVFCSRGGYGAVHLLDRIDFSGIKRNPKWVLGYSDITLLHAALQAQGIASLHGPMALHFSEEGADDFAVRSTKSILEGGSVDYRVPVEDVSRLNRRGNASGRLFGGNLSVFCSLLGSEYATVPAGGILFLEDIGEAPYRVDRMIHQLELAGVFRTIGGLMVGQFTDYEEDYRMYSPLQESIREVVDGYGFPVCFGFPVGHVKRNFPLIMGETAELNVGNDGASFKQ